MPRKKQADAAQIGLLEAKVSTAPCVPGIREKVKAWRGGGYKGVTDHGKPGKPSSTHEEGQPDFLTANYQPREPRTTFEGTNPGLHGTGQRLKLNAKG